MRSLDRAAFPYLSALVGVFALGFLGAACGGPDANSGRAPPSPTSG